MNRNTAKRSERLIQRMSQLLIGIAASFMLISFLGCDLGTYEKRAGEQPPVSTQPEDGDTADNG